VGDLAGADVGGEAGPALAVAEDHERFAAVERDLLRGAPRGAQHDALRVIGVGERGLADVAGQRIRLPCVPGPEAVRVDGFAGGAAGGAGRELGVAGGGRRNHRDEILRREFAERGTRGALDARCVVAGPGVARDVGAGADEVGGFEGAARVGDGGAEPLPVGPVVQRVGGGVAECDRGQEEECGANPSCRGGERGEGRKPEGHAVAGKRHPKETAEPRRTFRGRPDPRGRTLRAWRGWRG